MLLFSYFLQSVKILISANHNKFTLLEKKYTAKNIAGINKYVMTSSPYRDGFRMQSSPP